MSKQFEKRVIDSILNCIKDNQEYLTQKENLPQLAKLGYMYNTLWYAGRLASYDKIIERNQCNDNPKYKIEMCDPINKIIEDYIYDAWGMHVSNDYGDDWETFYELIVNGKELNETDKKQLKSNKTFDEWVDIFLSEDYNHYFSDRKSVANYLLCVSGTGYYFKDGYIINTASGAAQDKTDYGDWKNATFREDIQKIVGNIISDPDVIRVLEYQGKKKKEYREQEEAKEIESFGMTYKEYIKADERTRWEAKLKKWDKELSKEEMDNLINKLLGEKEEESKYKTYYPLSNYSIISKLDKHSHPSYINAAIEICEDIIANEEEEKKSEFYTKNNPTFARNFLKKVIKWGLKN